MSDFFSDRTTRLLIKFMWSYGYRFVTVTEKRSWILMAFAVLVKDTCVHEWNSSFYFTLPKIQGSVCTDQIIILHILFKYWNVRCLNKVTQTFAKYIQYKLNSAMVSNFILTAVIRQLNSHKLTNRLNESRKFNVCCFGWYLFINFIPKIQTLVATVQKSHSNKKLKSNKNYLV